MSGKVWRAPGRIPNAPLREAVLASGMTLRDICFALGWIRSDRCSKGADTTALKRTLGLEGTPCRSRASGGRSVSFVATIEMARAKLICDVLDVDFDGLYPDAPDASKPCGRRCGVCENPLLKPSPDGLCGFCREESEFGVAA